MAFESDVRIVALAVVRYRVWVRTGQVDSAELDPDAHVHLCLYGERGDTGKRLVSFMQSDHKEKFLEGQVRLNLPRLGHQQMRSRSLIRSEFSFLAAKVTKRTTSCWRSEFGSIHRPNAVMQRGSLHGNQRE